MKQPGKIISCPSGTGRTFDRDKLIGGKVPVYLLTEDLRPLMDENGKPRQVLVAPENITVKGYID